MTKWEFVAVPAPTDFQFCWRWHAERARGESAQSRKTFDFYFDCVQDARTHGYTGPMPRPTKRGAVCELSSESPRKAKVKRTAKRAQKASALPQGD